MTALAKVNGGFLVAPKDINELWGICKTLSESAFVPKDFRNRPGDVFAAIQHGAELGFSAMQSLQTIAPINGRPTVWGDGLLGLVLARPDCEDVAETWDEATQTAKCVVTRLRQTVGGVKPRITERTFSFEDAKRAGLSNKDTYKQYMKRMLQMRARGFALRDAYADVLRGIITREEAQDIPVQQVETTAVVVDKPPAKAIDATPKQPDPTSPDGPRFNDKWMPDEWGGRLMSDADVVVLQTYIDDVSEMKLATGMTPAKLEYLNATKAHAEHALALAEQAALTEKVNAAMGGDAPAEDGNQAWGV